MSPLRFSWRLFIIDIFRFMILLVLSISFKTQFNSAKLASDRSRVVRCFDFDMIVEIMETFPSNPCTPKYSHLGSNKFSSFSISFSSIGVSFHIQPAMFSDFGFALMILFMIGQFRWLFFIDMFFHSLWEFNIISLTR